MDATHILRHSLRMNEHPRDRPWLFLLPLWLGAVLVTFLVLHPLGRPLYLQIVPGAVHMIREGIFPWGAWLALAPRVLILTLRWLLWFLVGWLALWALDDVYTPVAHGRFPSLRLQSWTLIEILVLAPVLGAGITATPLILLGTGFMLSRWTVLLVLLLSCGALWLIGNTRRKRTNPDEPPEEPPNELAAAAIPLTSGAKEPTPLWIVAAAWVLIAIITAWTFFHSLCYPVDYWDALIYYVHYAELTYHQGGFPVIYQLQVGLGLGANYPHLYAVLQASQALLYGAWSDAYGQALMPLAGLGATLLLYSVVLRIYGRRDVAVLTALAFRLIPYVTTYTVWCSDYALVLYGTAAFLALLHPYLSHPVKDGDGLRLIFPVLIAAVFPQINYMGWIVWPPLCLAVFLRCGMSMPRLRTALPILALGVLWAIPWYIRNWIVTGNPVYAFFPAIFGGERIDLDVLASCQVEWKQNGDGLAQVGDTLWERILGTPLFFSYFWWKWSPVVLGLFLPGLALGWKHDSRRLYAVALLYALLVVFYGYVISGLYLYHMIAFFLLAAFFGARIFAAVRHRTCAVLLAGVMLVGGVYPGVAFSIMGPKARQAGLRILPLANTSPRFFYDTVGWADSEVWKYINANLEQGASILTHENRYHVFRRDLSLIHLDDWDLLPFYGRPWPEVRAELERRGITYYLQIPNEKNHRITERLGIGSHLDDFRLQFQRAEGTDEEGKPHGVRRLYRLRPATQKEN